MRSTLLWVIIWLTFFMAAADLEAGVFVEGDLLQLNFGPYMYHINQEPDRNDYPWYTGLEWESSSRWEIGGAVFSNSYYQPSGYLYGGKRFIHGSQDEHFFLKITAGALMGYVSPHEDVLPINEDGIGIGIVPAIGYKKGRMTIQVAILGVSALMLNLGYDIWK